MIAQIPGYLANALFLVACWAFLAAVWCSIALTRWRRTEAEDAAKTAAVMESLTADTTNDHIFDGA